MQIRTATIKELDPITQVEKDCPLISVVEAKREQNKRPEFPEISHGVIFIPLWIYDIILL
jgi:hypothetical protein